MEYARLGRRQERSERPSPRSACLRLCRSCLLRILEPADDGCAQGVVHTVIADNVARCRVMLFADAGSGCVFVDGRKERSDAKEARGQKARGLATDLKLKRMFGEAK